MWAVKIAKLQKSRDSRPADDLSISSGFTTTSVFSQSDYTGLDADANLRASRRTLGLEIVGSGLGLFGREPFSTRTNPTSENEEPSAPDSRFFDARELEKINIGCYELTLLLAESLSRSR